MELIFTKVLGLQHAMLPNKRFPFRCFSRFQATSAEQLICKLSIGTASVQLIISNQSKKIISNFCKKGPKTRRCKYRSSNSELLLKKIVPRKLAKSLKSSRERTLFLVKLQARGNRVSDHTFASSLASRAKERPSAITLMSLLYQDRFFLNL